MEVQGNPVRLGSEPGTGCGKQIPRSPGRASAATENSEWQN